MKPSITYEKKLNSRKVRLLAPFSSRYRKRLEFEELPPALRPIAAHILLGDDRRVLFVKNSKAGCTSVAHLLYRYYKGHEARGKVHDSNNGLIHGYTHWRECIDALSREETFKFTFVRHPETRVISAYHDFFVDQKNPLSETHLPYMQALGFSPDASATYNFDVFLELITQSFDGNLWRTDRHFRPQTINTAISDIAYDRIGRIETYAADIETIMKDAGLWSAPMSDWIGPPRNATRSSKYQPSPQQRRKVEALYRDDYEAFGYA